MSGLPNSASSGCYIGDVHVDGDSSGPLAGLTCVIKDSYDIAGHLTSNGSPAWRETHPPATTTAPAVQLLLNAGASVVGKTIMDELAYSLQGENAHYGTPTNPACPGHLSGGSSSGSAAAVAAGDVDFALGGDTGGSVRVPASFCGIFGFRPTHGRVDISGSCALAPSFDTGGWFARDASLLRLLGDVLLIKEDTDTKERENLVTTPRITFKRWLVGTDAFELADKEAGKAIYDVLSSKFDKVKDILGEPSEIQLGGGLGGGGGGGGGGDKGDSTAAAGSLGATAGTAAGLPAGGPRAWVEVFRHHQSYEAWQQHGEWLTRVNPTLGPGVKERFEAASRITFEEFQVAVQKRRAITAHLESILGIDGFLAMPTAAGPAPLIGSPPEQVDEFRGRLLSLTCIAGLAGLPEITLPIARVDGCPVGLSLIGPRGSDEALLELAEKLAGVLELNKK